MQGPGRRGGRKKGVVFASRPQAGRSKNPSVERAPLAASEEFEKAPLRARQEAYEEEAGQQNQAPLDGREGARELERRARRRLPPFDGV